MRHLTITLTAILAIALSGCGGGGEDSTTAATEALETTWGHWDYEARDAACRLWDLNPDSLVDTMADPEGDPVILDAHVELFMVKACHG